MQIINERRQLSALVCPDVSGKKFVRLISKQMAALSTFYSSSSAEIPPVTPITEPSPVPVQDPAKHSDQTRVPTPAPPPSEVPPIGPEKTPPTPPVSQHLSGLIIRSWL